MKRSAVLWLLFQVCLCFSTSAQVVERSRPEKWKQLVPGARFVDRFLPMPDGNRGTGIWGADSVLCRYVDNGIESPEISFRNLILGWKHFEIIRWEISSVRVRLGGKFSERTWNMVGLYCVPCGM